MTDAERALEEARRRSMWARPESVVVRRPDFVAVSTPSSPAPWYNRVCTCQLDEAAMEAELAARLADTRSRGATLRWTVGALDTPADLGARLEAAGVPYKEELIGMVADTGTTLTEIDATLALEPLRVADRQRYVRVARPGWGMSEAEAVELDGDLIRTMADPALLYFAAAPAGATQEAVCGVLRVGPGRAWGLFQGACVVPDQRGRGLYKQLVAARLRLLSGMGIRTAVVMARATTSAPLLSRWGFRAVTRYSIFEASPRSGPSARENVDALEPSEPARVPQARCAETD